MRALHGGPVHHTQPHELDGQLRIGGGLVSNGEIIGYDKVTRPPLRRREGGR